MSDGQVIVDGECLDTLLCNQLDEYRKNKVDLSSKILILLKNFQ